MQLDVTRITIRERGIFDLLDLGLRVMWNFSGPLLAAAALGILPMMLLNAWLLSDMVPDPSLYARNDYRSESAYASDVFQYWYYMIVLVAIEIPLATAPISLYLGRAVFEESPPFRSLWQQYWEMFPQLFVSRVLLRSLWLLPALLLLLTDEPGLAILGVMFLPLPFLIRPYATEVILLERNPMRAKRPGTVSTSFRNAMLHAHAFGDLFGRWFIVLLVGVVWTFSLWYSVSQVFEILSGGAPGTTFEYAWSFPAVLWFTVAFSAVVRFLSYLDLRIRREGWEVELRMRAEGNRIARQLV